MSRDELLERIIEICTRVQQSAQGIADHLGEYTPENAAEDILDLIPVDR